MVVRVLRHPTMQGREDQLKGWRTTMLDYLRMKFEQEDWHGVMDAAADLRDIDERLAGIKEGSK